MILGIFIKILIGIINMSMAGSVIIILAYIVRALLKRVSKIYTCILWAIVGIRLIVPYGINFQSIINIFKGEKIDGIFSRTEYIPQSIGKISFDGLSQNIGFISIGLFLFFSIWFLGVVLMILFEIVAFASMKKRLVNAFKVQENVYKTNQISTPFLVGLIGPKIYVPDNMTDKELKYVLNYEFIKIKRKATFFSFLEWVILSLHWFNPTVWAAYKYMNIDLELSYDEKVSYELGNEEKKEYIKVITSFSEKTIKEPKSMLIYKSSNYKSRIENLLNNKKNNLIGTVFATFASLFILVFFIFNSPISSSLNFVRNSIYEYELGHLVSTDLDDIRIDQIQIGSDIEDIDLSKYSTIQTGVLSNYTYDFNQLSIDVDNDNKVNNIFAVYEAANLIIKEDENISSIDDVVRLLGDNHLNKSYDWEQRLRKYVYFDKELKIVGEFIYAEFDGSLVFISLEKIEY